MPATVTLIDRRAPRVLAVSVGLTALLYAIPFGRTIGWPLVLISTLAHELPLDDGDPASLRGEPCGE